MDFTFLVQSLIDGTLTGGVYAVVAIGLTMIFGVMHIINFAHGSFMMLGMYASYFVFTSIGIDPYISILLIMPLFFLMGFIIQNQVLQMGLKVNLTRLIAFVLAILMGALLYLLLKKTYLGKAMRAVSQEKEGALAVGINFNRIFCIAFGIGTACVAAAGAIIAPFLWISPNIGFHYVILAFVTVVLGGMGNFIGAILGGLIIGVVEALGASFLPGSLKDVIIFSIFALVLLYKPTGLFEK
jgi:branched-chain amino acid transport system permease protein